ncbi:hypothetical protein [Eubacterium sp.]|uniref:hypothetical protein n=1 Tax=Eubacterium sp. TaxID=142586 RepID=UPI0025BB5A93|nr:hypothetical protein [Eubacterium sp.]
MSIDNIPLDDIEEAFEDENTETEGCSSLMTPAPPRKQSRKWLLFLSAVIETAYNQNFCNAKYFGIKSRNNRTAKHTKGALRSAVTAFSTKKRHRAGVFSFYHKSF